MLASLKEVGLLPERPKTQGEARRKCLGSSVFFGEGCGSQASHSFLSCPLCVTPSSL